MGQKARTHQQSAACEHVFHTSSVEMIAGVTHARLCKLCDHFEMLVGEEWLTTQEFHRALSERVESDES